MGDTDIEWTHAPGFKGVTWNPIRGCQLKSPGCVNCYAQKQAARIISFNRGRNIPEGHGAYDGLVRIGADGKARWNGSVQIANNIRDPLGWRTKRMVFVNSMSDLFYEGFDDHVRDQIMAVMLISSRHERSPGHVFQVLTKRDDVMLRYMTDPETIGRIAKAAAFIMEDSDGWHDAFTYGENKLVDDHLWLGVSVENQEVANTRIPTLAKVPAAVRFLSIEPLLERIDLTGLLDGIHWVIAGSESGDDARPAEEDWYRDIRDQCAEANVPYLLKQFAHNGRKIPTPELDGRRHVEWPHVLTRPLAQLGLSI